MRKSLLFNITFYLHESFASGIPREYFITMTGMGQVSKELGMYPRSSPSDLLLIEAEWRIYASIDEPPLAIAKPLFEPMLEHCWFEP